jgi:hypothetical protein
MIDLEGGGVALVGRPSPPLAPTLDPSPSAVVRSTPEVDDMTVIAGVVRVDRD